MLKNTFTIQLVHSEQLSDTVTHFYFKKQDGQPLFFTPGQFITLLIGDEHKPLRRSYSIASIPDTEKTDIEFAASYIKEGKASELLFHLKAGDTLLASGPFGRLTLRDDESPQRFVLVATGTGVTPYRAMIPALKTRMQAQKTKVCLVLGVRTHHDLLYGDLFTECAQQFSLFEFHVSYSKPLKPLHAPYEHEGYVQHHFEKLHLRPQEDIIYLCGNPNMVDEASEQLKALSFDLKNIRREKYISSN